MLTSKEQLAVAIEKLQPGQGIELSHSEIDRIFGAGTPRDDALKEAEAFAGSKDCTFFNEGREHDQRVVFRKGLPPS